LDLDLLRRISRSIGETAIEAGVEIITGDTKVVEKGGVKGMIVTTSGIGHRSPLLDPCLDRARSLRKDVPWTETRWLRDDLVRPGDSILITGTTGDHGIALLSFREGYGFETDVSSDGAPLNGLMERAMRIGGVVSAKDLTRGGLANALNEWASKSGSQIMVDESSIPVVDPVRSACDLLGIDPYEIGNEGKAILAVASGAEEEVLSAIRSDRYGKDAAIIGRAEKGPARVILRTVVGGKRIMDPPYGDPIPRIC
jgi:hydrogenase expression/formation protein HypE